MSIIEKIFEYPFLMRIFNALLTDKEKISLISNKYINNNKFKLKFYRRYRCIKKDKKKWHYNCLTNIIVRTLFRFPVNVNHVTFDDSFTNTIKNISKLNKNITYLTFGNFFNKPVENFIPNSVTHLKFGDCFNKPVKFLPNSVKHLKLGKFYYIRELSLFITCLTIQYSDQKLAKLPSLLTKLKCSNIFFEKNKDIISSTTKVIIY